LRHNRLLHMNNLKNLIPPMSQMTATKLMTDKSLQVRHDFAAVEASQDAYKSSQESIVVGLRAQVQALEGDHRTRQRELAAAREQLWERGEEAEARASELTRECEWLREQVRHSLY